MESETSHPAPPAEKAGRRFFRAGWRAVRAAISIERKLTLAFSLLLMLALATTSWLSVTKTQDALSDILGEQAKQISQTLAMAASTPYEAKDIRELQRLGRELLRSRNIVLVIFFDANGQPLAAACRDSDFTLQKWQSCGGLESSPQHLMQVTQRNLPSMGDFLQVTAPVFDVFQVRRSDPRRPGESGTHLLGYLTVGVTQNSERAQLNRVNALGIAVGSLIFIVALPLALGVVHRIFLPIRQLVAATNRIASGDYDAHVATHRPDEIGMLARSFNDMAIRIRQHEQELKVANENLAEANRSLEGKVHQRTRELESSNQRLSAEIAEKEDFLRAVSHDLNAPLRNISGMATILLMKYREKFEEDIVHRLERICKNVDVETDLIAELLELSRIKTRRQKFEAVDIGKLVSELAGVFEQDLKERNIALMIEGTLPVLLCERSRLRQVFQNLIDNAIKYMGSGAVREIHVGSSSCVEGAEFFVRDTGIGIDKEDAQKAFYVFRRGKNSAEMNVGGKGVGLATVKSIVETYAGRIWLESKVGKGSTFRFTIARRFIPPPGSSMEQAAGAAELLQRGAAA